ncbi:endolytic transglycosylase MltG [Fulvivirgaceae bacterium PWU4]|uniref:Endolytic murein transglycosylase n=1 Tax=Chryseosolibacter histidini TaxID=2782349 RepID=A0AAP2DHS9_9BACT|nr:endolytic transglycosylase MltG [Chryseosolibacter histidini]MBT1695462.1 endolytic transglycosylase MltG [Chryseosolibacter histidini]
MKRVVFLTALFLLIAVSFYAYRAFYSANILVDKEDSLFVINAGASYQTVLGELTGQNIVQDRLSFQLLARLKGFDKKIQPGRYKLRRNMTNLAAMSALMESQEPVNITFNNVRLLPELYEKITRGTDVTPKEFEEALNQFIATNQEGFTKENILCMFIPNTYQVYANVSPAGLVERMHKEYVRFWTDDRKAKAAKLGMTPIEVSILASIVQAESIKPEEAPLIACLYLNRLKTGMPLQADPTLVFASGDFGLKRVLNVHKEIDSPYNTYKFAGLPPGPINMPTISNLDAVLNPAPKDYLYMCAREDFSGYHNFASDIYEHGRNAARYRAALTIEMRKGAALRKKAKKG